MTAKSPTQRILALPAALALIVGLAGAAYWRSISAWLAPPPAPEVKLIQGHPQASYEVLKDVQFAWPVAQVALQHHERMDGSGYPHGLKGEALLV